MYSSYLTVDLSALWIWINHPQAIKTNFANVSVVVEFFFLSSYATAIEKKTAFSVGHGRCHVVNSPPIFGIGRMCHFRTASWTAQFSNIFYSFRVLSAELEAFENVMLPFAGAVNGLLV